MRQLRLDEALHEPQVFFHVVRFCQVEVPYVRVWGAAVSPRDEVVSYQHAVEAHVQSEGARGFHGQVDRHVTTRQNTSNCTPARYYTRDSYSKLIHHASRAFVYEMKVRSARSNHFFDKPPPHELKLLPRRGPARSVFCLKLLAASAGSRTLMATGTFRKIDSDLPPWPAPVLPPCPCVLRFFASMFRFSLRIFVFTARARASHASRHSRSSSSSLSLVTSPRRTPRPH